MLRRTVHEGGFTLLEVGLAIGIGLLITAAATVFYNQVRDSAGDAGMRERLASLQSVVENLYSAQGSCPALATVQQAWVQKRPNDCLSSPWGGTILANNPAGITGGDLAQNASVDWNDSVGSLGAGGLYFYRITTSPAPGIPSMTATASMWDVSQASYSVVTGYGVAGLKGSNAHFMVTSGR